jgi:hypothetical protein
VINAAANADGTDVTLFRRITRSGNTSIVDVGPALTSFLGEPEVEPFSVKGIRVDDLLDGLDGRVNFMKIDVEGAEPLVFRGAQKTIQSNPDLWIVMEWSPGQIKAAGFDLVGFLAELKAMGLSLFQIKSGRPAPLSFNELLNIPYNAGVLFRRSS